MRRPAAWGAIIYRSTRQVQQAPHDAVQASIVLSNFYCKHIVHPRPIEFMVFRLGPLFGVLYPPPPLHAIYPGPT